MMKVLVFDMDGTIADLYGVTDWLTKLRDEDVTPYKDAAPMYDMAELAELLNTLKALGWMVAVTSWLAMDSSPEYKAAVRNAKTDWLNRYGFPYDELHLVQYGTTKANCTRHKGGYQVLVDDNAKIRNGWNLGGTIDANKNILDELKKLAGI